MSTELLQAEAQQGTETPPQAGAESATAMGENPELNNAGDSSEGAEGNPADQQADPARFTKRINQKHHEVMEERRARIAVEQELANLRAQQPQAQRPVVPPVPDPYDDNFDQLMRDRDVAIEAAKEFDLKQHQDQIRQQQQQQQAVDEQQQQMVNTAEAYSKRAADLNVSQQELQVAGQTVAAYGISNELTFFILDDDQGPLITTYLARNPEEIEVLNSMNPMQAAVHVATNVKAKATAAKPNNGAPPPAETLGGGGATPSKRGPSGATFT